MNRLRKRQGQRNQTGIGTETRSDRDRDLRQCPLFPGSAQTSVFLVFVFFLDLSLSRFSVCLLVRGGGLKPTSANDAEGPEEFDVIDISKLKNVDE